MTNLQAALLGLVEGLTEFLPVSSTAHLILTSTILGLPQSPYVTMFEVFIQLGAIAGVIVLYASYVKEHTKLLYLLLLSFLPTALVGFILHGVIKSFFFNSNELIAASLILFGIAFIAIEYVLSKGLMKLSNNLADLTPRAALFIGLMQACAVVPGVSRAGAVILTMMLLKYRRKDAAVYSFLLAVPTIAAAAVYDVLKFDVMALNRTEWTQLGIGSAVACISAVVCMRLLIQYVQQRGLAVFGAYRIVLGFGILWLLW